MLGDRFLQKSKLSYKGAESASSSLFNIGNSHPRPKQTQQLLQPPTSYHHASDMALCVANHSQSHHHDTHASSTLTEYHPQRHQQQQQQYLNEQQQQQQPGQAPSPYKSPRLGTSQSSRFLETAQQTVNTSKTLYFPTVPAKTITLASKAMAVMTTTSQTTFTSSCAVGYVPPTPPARHLETEGFALLTPRLGVAEDQAAPEITNPSHRLTPFSIENVESACIKRSQTLNKLSSPANMEIDDNIVDSTHTIHSKIKRQHMKDTDGQINAPMLPKTTSFDAAAGCVVCRFCEETPGNLIVHCRICGKGYHQLCYSRLMDARAIQPAESSNWVCHACACPPATLESSSELMPNMIEDSIATMTPTSEIDTPTLHHQYHLGADSPDGSPPEPIQETSIYSSSSFLQHQQQQQAPIPRHQPYNIPMNPTQLSIDLRQQFLDSLSKEDLVSHVLSLDNSNPSMNIYPSLLAQQPSGHTFAGGNVILPLTGASVLAVDSPDTSSIEKNHLPRRQPPLASNCIASVVHLQHPLTNTSIVLTPSQVSAAVSENVSTSSNLLGIQIPTTAHTSTSGMSPSTQNISHRNSIDATSPTLNSFESSRAPVDSPFGTAPITNSIAPLIGGTGGLASSQLNHVPAPPRLRRRGTVPSVRTSSEGLLLSSTPQGSRLLQRQSMDSILGGATFSSLSSSSPHRKRRESLLTKTAHPSEERGGSLKNGAAGLGTADSSGTNTGATEKTSGTYTAIKSDDLPPYEDMIFQAIAALSEDAGSAPKTILDWIAANIPVHDLFRGSCGQAISKAAKKGKLIKHGALYKLNPEYDYRRIPRGSRGEASRRRFTITNSSLNHAPQTKHLGDLPDTATTTMQGVKGGLSTFSQFGEPAITVPSAQINPRLTNPSVIPAAPSATAMYSPQPMLSLTGQDVPMGFFAAGAAATGFVAPLQQQQQHQQMPHESPTTGIPSVLSVEQTTLYNDQRFPSRTGNSLTVGGLKQQHHMPSTAKTRSPTSLGMHPTFLQGVPTHPSTVDPVVLQLHIQQQKLQQYQAQSNQQAPQKLQQLGNTMSSTIGATTMARTATSTTTEDLPHDNNHNNGNAPLIILPTEHPFQGAAAPAPAMSGTLRARSSPSHSIHLHNRTQQQLPNASITLDQPVPCFQQQLCPPSGHPLYCSLQPPLSSNIYQQYYQLSNPIHQQTVAPNYATEFVSDTVANTSATTMSFTTTSANVEGGSSPSLQPPAPHLILQQQQHQPHQLPRQQQEHIHLNSAALPLSWSSSVQAPSLYWPGVIDLASSPVAGALPKAGDGGESSAIQIMAVTNPSPPPALSPSPASSSCTPTTDITMLPTKEEVDPAMHTVPLRPPTATPPPPDEAPMLTPPLQSFATPDGPLSVASTATTTGATAIDIAYSPTLSSSPSLSMPNGLSSTHVA